VAVEESLHRAARAEDALKAALGSVLRRRGWRPQVLAYTGYGSDGWVRVLGRVLLARTPDPHRPVREESEQVVRGWRSFLTAPVAGADVEVQVGGRRHVVRADRSGYLDSVVDSDLGPGWNDVRLAVEGRDPVTARVIVVGAGQEYGVVSDIDDTVMVTSLPRPLIAAWNTFVLHEQARYVVPGMAPLYREIVVRRPDTPVFYLSTGAWNVAPTLTRFLARHGYPDGPMLLTDWGPTNTGWFRSGREHKRGALRRLRRELPGVRWLLIGDDGQHDPDIYSEFAAEAGDVVRAIAIRQLSVGEQVLAHGTPAPLADAERTAPATAPEVRGPDGTRLGNALRDAGLL
jgi:phosphatidate phosphatase APP1